MVTLVVFIKNKTMKNFKLLVIGLLVGCFPSFEPKNVLKKEIDTICEAHNIKDFTLKNNTITIKFLGTPKKYNYPIEIPEHIYEYNIKVDTIN